MALIQCQPNVHCCIHALRKNTDCHGPSLGCCDKIICMGKVILVTGHLLGQSNVPGNRLNWIPCFQSRFHIAKLI